MIMAEPHWVRAMLKGRPYGVLHHPPALSAWELAHREHVSGHEVAKVVVVAADGYPVMLVLPADRRVDFEAARKALACDVLRLADEDELAHWFKDSDLGAEPPLRRGSIEVWMDESLRGEGDIVFQGGTHEDAIKMPFKDWFALVKPREAAFSV